MASENPASSPSAGTNPAQQLMMQQMLQMFAGGNASVRTTHILSSLILFYCLIDWLTDLIE